MPPLCCTATCAVLLRDVLARASAISPLLFVRAMPSSGTRRKSAANKALLQIAAPVHRTLARAGSDARRMLAAASKARQHVPTHWQRHEPAKSKFMHCAATDSAGRMTAKQKSTLLPAGAQYPFNAMHSHPLQHVDMVPLHQPVSFTLPKCDPKKPTPRTAMQLRQDMVVLDTLLECLMLLLSLGPDGAHGKADPQWWGGTANRPGPHEKRAPAR